MTASFPVETSVVTTTTTGTQIIGRIRQGSGYYQLARDLTISSASWPVIRGVSPATAPPGESAMVAYTENLVGATFTVFLAGPVYGLTNLSVPLCDLAAGSCPTAQLGGTLNTQTGDLAFGLPADLGAGYYALRVQESTGRTTGWIWVGVSMPSVTLPALTPEQHSSAKAISRGQTINGAFVEAGDPQGNLGDYNFFYFVGSAGSTIDVSLQRLDTSMPWENPASLDPQIEIIAPDGRIYANLTSTDDIPSLDLNASLHGAVLPQTGIYILAAETTRGSGAYGLTFNLTPASVDPNARMVPISGNDNTAGLNVPLTMAAYALDPRGYPVSGASVDFLVQNSADNGAQVAWVGSNSVTSGPDGSVVATCKVTTPGKVEISPIFSWAQFSEPPPGKVLALQPEAVRQVPPAYPAVGRWHLGQGLMIEGGLALNPGRRERFPTPPARLRAGGGRVSRASDGRPEPKNDARRDGPVPDLITSCRSGVFHAAGISQTDVHPPFTMKLEDLSPAEGNTQPNGVVDTVDGIHGHRIEKVIRLKLTFKDATGQEPSHPLLVSFAVGGKHRGRLILDPDGAKVECADGSFLWHEQDAQGNLIARNEILEYRFGTESDLVGFVSDPDNPGKVKPVWGDAESLRLAVSTPDPNGSLTLDRTLDLAFPVRPEPGKPDHFFCIDLNGNRCPDVFPFWTGYLAFPSGTKGDGSQRLVTNPNRILDSYVLGDKYENVAWGYTSTYSTSPAPNVTVGFTDQSTTGDLFEAYTVAVSWTNDPSFPQGDFTATLGVNYPADPDWPAAGAVTKAITLSMATGTTHVLARFRDYDAIVPDGQSPPQGTPGVADGVFPISVSPHAKEGGLPKTSAGDTPRLVLLTQTGQLVPGILPQPEPTLTGARQWFPNGVNSWRSQEVIAGTDNHLETSVSGSFRFTLIDSDGRPAADGQFAVHVCPRFPRWVDATPCPTPESTVSAGGKIDSAQVNVSGTGRGYIGIELLAAPTRPGVYYVNVESLDQIYRVRRESDFVTAMNPAAGESAGAFAVCTVTGVEFLDQNFQRTEPIPLSGPTTAYLRIARGSGASTGQALLTTSRLNGATMSSNVVIPVERVGASDTYLGRFQLIPEDYTAPAAKVGAADKVPSASAPTGLGHLHADSPTGPAEGQSLKKGRLRIRFMKREVPQLCFVSPSDTCLTEPRPELPDQKRGEQQETLIDPGRHYAERVNLLIDVADDKGQTIETAALPLSVLEDPNLLYEDNPALNRRRLFYDGLPENPGSSSSKLTSDGLVDGSRIQLSAGRAAVSLFSVAEAKFFADPPSGSSALIYATPFTAKLFAAPASSYRGADSPGASDSIFVGAWVDEQTYLRNRENPSCDPIWGPLQVGVPNSPDWIEMQTLDYCSTTGSQGPGDSEVDAVFRQIRTVSVDLSMTYRGRSISGAITPSDSTRIYFCPAEAASRYDTHGSSIRGYYGLQMQIPADLYPAEVTSHEARHSWQIRLPLLRPECVDNDHDYLVLSPPASSPELLDAHYSPTIMPDRNPEGEFQGDAVGDGVSTIPVRERNAERFASQHTGILMSCPNYILLPTSYDSGSSKAAATVYFQQSIFGGIPEPLPAAVLRVESAAAGSDCASDSWSLEGYVMADVNGVATYRTTGPKRVRFTFEPPYLVTSPVPTRCSPPPKSSDCVDVP